MGLALGLGIGLSFGGGGDASGATDYLGRPALFELNNSDSRYSLNGSTYANAAALYAALGATVSGIKATFGDFDASSYEYFPDPGFDNPATFNPVAAPYAAGGGFTPTNTGGQLKITSAGGGSPYVSFRMQGYPQRAFRASAKGRGGSVTTNLPRFQHTQTNSSLGGNLIPSAVTMPTGASFATCATHGSGKTAGGNCFFGWRGTSTGSGDLDSDDWFIKETFPLPGWSVPADGNNALVFEGWGALADFIAPAAPVSGEKTILYGDCSNAVHHVRLIINTSGNLRLIAQMEGSERANLDLGTLTPGNRYRVAFGMKQGTNVEETGIVASLNGAPRVKNEAATVSVPGFALLRLNRDYADTNVFDGTSNQISVFKGRPPADWCEYSSRLNDNSIPLGGDSYGDGANNVSLKASLATSTGLPMINLAVGGSTLADQVARLLPKTYLKGLRYVHWDGSDNGYGTIAEDVANYQQMYDFFSGRTLFVAPVPVPNPAAASSPTPSAASIRCAARYAAMVTAFGAGHMFDALSVLQGLSTGSADDLNDVAAGLVPRSCLYDASVNQVHLSQVAMTAVADAIQASGKIAAL